MKPHTTTRIVQKEMERIAPGGFESLKKPIPKPYYGLMFKKFILWEGIIRPLIIGAIPVTIVSFIVEDPNTSRLFIWTGSIAMIFWIASLYRNFIKIMNLLFLYQEDEKGVMEKLRTMFPNAKEKK